MILHPESHTSHVPNDVLMYVLGRYHGLREPVIFKSTFTLPGWFVDLPSALYGPVMGDAVVTPCVLFTVFGGPMAPRELFDPTLPASERSESERFWSEHALSTHGV